MQGTWAYTELGVFGGSETSAPWTLSWLDTYAEHRAMCKCIIYTWFPNKRYHVTQCCMTVLVESLSVCTRREQEQIKVIPFKCSLMNQWVFGGLLTGAWVRGYLKEHGWFQQLLCQKKHITPAWVTTQKTCITRVPWTTCTFLYRGRIASSPPIAYYLYNYLPSFMRLTAEVNFSKKIHKKSIS